MAIFKRCLSFLLIFGLCLGSYFSFSGTLDVLSSTISVGNVAVNAVKSIIGGDVFNLPVSSAITADIIIGGKTVRQRIADQFSLFSYLHREDSESFPRNLTAEDIIAVNPNIFYVYVNDVEVEAILFTAITYYEDTPVEREIFWLRPINLLQTEDSLDSSYVFRHYEVFDTLYTTLYYYPHAAGIVPIFDFNNFTGQTVSWAMDFFNNIVYNYFYYDLDNVIVANDIEFEEYFELIGVYNPNV